MYIRSSMEDLHENNCSTELQEIKVYNNFAGVEDIESARASADMRAQSHRQGRCIHRVPAHLRRDDNQQVYDPMVLSLGPYHHGKPEFHRMEEIKDELLTRFVSNSLAKDATKGRGFFYREILKNVNEIRHNYDREGVDEYNDEALAEIILCDAFFLISYMEDTVQTFSMIRDRLGMSTAVFIIHDILILENQIPFWVIKSLLDLRFGENEADILLCQHLSFLCFGSSQQLRGFPWKDDGSQPVHLRFRSSHQLRQLPWKDDGSQPLHLLEALRTTLIKREISGEATGPTTKTKPHFLTKLFKCKKMWKNGSKSIYDAKSQDLIAGNIFRYANLPFRSVTYLQSKGVYFVPSTYCYKDIVFTSYSCYGKVQLPTRFVNVINTKAILSNLIAFEMSPGYPIDYTVTGYVSFMKSLIETPKDVKELREKGILFSTLGSDEEVVKMYKEIQTYGLIDYDCFACVKMQIDEHCNSRTKIWIAEFVHNYCHSPWTVIALFAATFLLCLTFLQTYYTI